ncbi:hypothetical protein Hanom_Chr01g00009131 [Helianthus anomalus]
MKVFQLGSRQRAQSSVTSVVVNNAFRPPTFTNETTVLALALPQATETSKTTKRITAPGTDVEGLARKRNT